MSFFMALAELNRQIADKRFPHIKDKKCREYLKNAEAIKRYFGTGFNFK